MCRERRRFAGMEHWLPFYYERLDTLFDYLHGAPVVLDHLAPEAIDERHKLILDYYEARRQQTSAGLKDAVPYKPTPPGLLYLTPEDVTAALADHLAAEFTPFDTPDAGPRSSRTARDSGSKPPTSVPTASSSTCTAALSCAAESAPTGGSSREFPPRRRRPC